MTRKKNGKEKMRVRWNHMMRRCYNEKTCNYHNYGGRGIYVCERWHSFENFYADFGDIATGMSIDRIDNDGPYAPDNVRLATPKQQSRNRRDLHLIEYNGIIACAEEWAERVGITGDIIKKRMWRGWSAEEALTIPVYGANWRISTYRKNKAAQETK